MREEPGGADADGVEIGWDCKGSLGDWRGEGCVGVVGSLVPQRGFLSCQGRRAL